MKVVLVALAYLIPIHRCAEASSDGDGSNRGIIKSIEYKYEGDESPVPQEVVDSRVQLKVGAEFSPFLADASIKSLYASGNFDHVSVKVDELSGSNDYKVTFSLTPREQIKAVNFVGNGKIKEKTLRKKLESKPGTNVSESTIKSDVETLTKFYYDKGYPYVKISSAISKAPDSGDVTLTFNISEGEKLRVGKITFAGNGDVKREKLLEVMRTRKWTLFSIFTKFGVYRPAEFSSDIDALKTVFRNHGFLDVEIDEEKITYVRRGKSLHICIPVELGHKYYVGSVTIKGNKLYPLEKLEKTASISPNDVFSPAELDDAKCRIADLYGQSGYINTDVVLGRKPVIESDKIDVEFAIEETERCFVGEIEIRGNSKTKNKVILRELSLAPGDQFDIVRMKNGRARLMNTGYFSSVDAAPTDTNVPERKNLRIDVREADTGKGSIGGGISTGGEIVGFVEFTQRNFDLSSKNKMFQGGGQKFRSRLQMGKHTTFIDINFEEPWWYDRKLAIGTDLYFHKTDYDDKMREYSGGYYNEDRIGGDVYLKKHIYELWEGKLSYGLENVKIYKISANSPQCFFDREGNSSISKVTLSIERDSRDSFVYPTTGSRVGVDTEVAGGPFFGNTKYVKVSAAAVKHWLVSETAEQVFSLIGRTGTITPYGGQTTPFFERFHLGGANFMKGFKSHDVGPRERNVGVGGNTFAYGSAEYCVQVADPVRIYFFAEAGFVNETQWNFSTKRYNTDVGVGLKISIMGMPLRLDFGFPLHGEGDNKHGMRFNYSFGVAF
ncbi:MAG: outer membrane protein assembly factor BamA [Puniceicoccales bacterium]|nr:outer membrane protein assembly factor BamA [Puniceicoccales bacterium]